MQRVGLWDQFISKVQHFCIIIIFVTRPINSFNYYDFFSIVIFETVKCYIFTLRLYVNFVHFFSEDEFWAAIKHDRPTYNYYNVILMIYQSVIKWFAVIPFCTSGTNVELITPGSVALLTLRPLQKNHDCLLTFGIPASYYWFECKFSLRFLQVISRCFSLGGYSSLWCEKVSDSNIMQITLKQKTATGALTHNYI